MSEVSAEQQPNEQTDESRVIEYLQKNPAILMDYPDIFSSLSIPHQTGGAISLVERQLKLLRDDNKHLRSKIEELVSIARDNEELNQRFHCLALELMDTGQLHDVLAMVQDQVQTFFYTDFVCFRFLPDISETGNTLDGLYLNADNGIVERISPWIDARKPICGQHDDDTNRDLFGPDLQIASSAFIPLYHTRNLGLLCLGSVSAERFGPSMGTIFLQHLGELVSNRLKNLLQVG